MPVATTSQGKIILIRGTKELESAFSELASFCGVSKGQMLKDLVSYYTDTRLRTDTDMLNFVRERRDRVLHSLETVPERMALKPGRPRKA